VCASDCVEDARVLFGRVEQTTIVRKGVGPPGTTVRLGSVRLEGGGVVLARLDPDLNEGQRARLADDDGVIVARTV
jgi:hypothetical protein